MGGCFPANTPAAVLSIGHVLADVQLSGNKPLCLLLANKTNGFAKFPFYNKVKKNDDVVPGFGYRAYSRWHQTPLPPPTAPPTAFSHFYYISILTLLYPTTCSTTPNPHTPTLDEVGFSLSRKEVKHVNESLKTN